MDATLARKKAEVNEALKAAPRDPRTVRIYVYNTWKEASPGEDASWTLHVQGRVLAPHECADGAAGGDYDPETEPKFSEFVRDVEIRLDPTSAPPKKVPALPGAAITTEGDETDPPAVRWDAAKAPADAKPVDGFEVKRLGDKDRKAKILIAVKHTPERYKPKPELSRLLGLDLETRPRLIAALWQYCRLNDLLDKEDATKVDLDDRLKSLFGDKESAKFVDLCEIMCSRCLDPSPPIELDYVVRTRGRKNPTHPDCYDLLVDVPGGDKQSHHFVEALGRDAEIASLDEKIQAGIKKIEKHLRRRSYFLGFSHSPVDFINTVVAQQARDIAIVRNDGRKRRLAERRSDHYNKPWVDEAVMQYVTRVAKSGKI